MNKEGLAADLVCLLDERSKPRNSAKFQEQIERFLSLVQQESIS